MGDRTFPLVEGRVSHNVAEKREIEAEFSGNEAGILGLAKRLSYLDLDKFIK